MAFEHYDKCSLLLPMDGANNGTDFPDWSPNPKTVTVFGNAKTVTAISKYYGSSAYFNGTGDYLTVPNSADVFGPGDNFTIAGWFNTESTDATNTNFIATTRSELGIGWALYIEAGSSTHGLSFLAWDAGLGSAVILNPTDTIANNTFAHIAVVKIGDNWTLYLNGFSIATTTQSNPVSAGHTIMTIGRNPFNQSRYWKGWMQDLIISDAALWTDNFTPPTRLVGELSNTNAANPVEDETGTPAERTIIAVPRNYPTRAFGTVSDVNGDFTLRAPATECSVFAIHEGSPIKNDLIHRVTPV